MYCQVYRSMWVNLRKHHLTTAHISTRVNLSYFLIPRFRIVRSCESARTGGKHRCALAPFFLSSRRFVVPMLVSGQNWSSCLHFLIVWARVSNSRFCSKLVCLPSAWKVQWWLDHSPYMWLRTFFSAIYWSPLLVLSVIGKCEKWKKNDAKLASLA